MKNKRMIVTATIITLILALATAAITVHRREPAAPSEDTLADFDGSGAGDTEGPQSESGQGPGPSPEAEPVFEKGVICPLGGEMVEESELYPRPVAVMLDNHPAARPQAGWEQADVVYEVLAEGNITRYLALFMHGSDQLVGPVRSARTYFLDISMEYNAVYLHAGGSPGAWDDITKLKIPSFNAMNLGAPLYWREKHRKEPHNIYTALHRIQASAEARGYNRVEGVQVHSFNEKDEGIKGEKADRVSIAYPQKYNVHYEFSPEEGVYLRYVAGKPHVDENNNDYQVRVKNIIIQEAIHRVVDDEGRRDIDLVGSGEGIYITKGYYIPITWSKKDRRSPTHYYFKDKREIKLNPGKTWIQIVPRGSKTTIE